MINVYLQTTNIRDNGFLIVLPKPDNNETSIDEAVVVSYFSDVDKAKKSEKKCYFNEGIFTAVAETIQSDTGRNSDNSIVIKGINFNSFNDLEKERFMIKIKSFLDVSIKLIIGEYEKTPSSKYSSVYFSRIVSDFQADLNTNFCVAEKTVKKNNKLLYACIAFILIATIGYGTPRILKWLGLTKKKVQPVEVVQPKIEVKEEKKAESIKKIEPKDGLKEFCKQFGIDFSAFQCELQKEPKVASLFESDTYKDKLLEGLESNKWPFALCPKCDDLKAFYGVNDSVTPENIVKYRKTGQILAVKINELRELIKKNKQGIFAIQSKMETQFPSCKPLYAFYKGFFLNWSIDGYEERYECVVPFITKKDVDIVNDINGFFKGSTYGPHILISDLKERDKCFSRVRDALSFTEYCEITNGALKKNLDFMLEDIGKANERINAHVETCNIMAESIGKIKDILNFGI